MVFCKRYHKRVIKIVTSIKEFRDRCRCDLIVEARGKIFSKLSSDPFGGFHKV